MRRARSRIANERGATLVFAALLIVALFGMFSVAVDVGAWLNTRGEAQRVADAAALAGAGIYMYQEGDADRPADMVAGADASARDFAGRNYVGRTMVDAGASSDDGDCTSGPEVDVCVEPANQLVRVTVRGRTNSLFAHLLGVDLLPVTARAAARVIQAGAASCVKPFAIPDMWNEATQDNAPNNRVWDFDRGAGCKGNNCPQPENWSYDPDAGDVYNRDLYGYGTGYRDTRVDWRNQQHSKDYGRRVPIKIQDAHDVNVASYWYPWRMPDSDPGLKGVLDGITQCVPQAQIGEEVEQFGVTSKNGNSPKPIYDEFKKLIAQDPDAYWDEAEGTVAYRSGSTSQYKDNWRASPRVITIAVVNPESFRPGRNTMKFVDFVQMFLEDPDETYPDLKPAHFAPITGRMLHYVQGQQGPVAGNLTRMLQLVE